MEAVIHAVDTDRRASEGKDLSVRSVGIAVAVKQYDGLPLGEPMDRCYVEVTAEGWDGPTKSTLTARFTAVELQGLFDAAVKAGLIVTPIRHRIIELVEELRAELAICAERRPGE